VGSEKQVAEDTDLRGQLGLPGEGDEQFVADRPLSAYAAETKAAGHITA